MHRTSGALATKPHQMATTERPPVMRQANYASAVQGSLFSQNVVTMPPRGPQPGRATTTRTTTRTRATGSSQNPGTKQAARRTQPIEGQGELEFLEPIQPKARTLATTVEAMIYCEAPVATPMHRALAVALDWSMVLIGYGLFLLVFALCGGEFEFTRGNSMIFGGAFALIAFSYSLYWIILKTESAGMRWAHLRLITFDGFPPEKSQRFMRLAGSCLSMFSVLGIFWSLSDEESLGWQDHMSRTFPTPHELESRVFRRH